MAEAQAVYGAPRVGLDLDPERHYISGGGRQGAPRLESHSHRVHHRPPPVEGLWNGPERAWDAESDFDSSTSVSLPVKGGGDSVHFTEPTAQGGRWYVLCPKQGSAPAVPLTPCVPLLGSSLQSGNHQSPSSRDPLTLAAGPCRGQRARVAHEKGKMKKGNKPNGRLPACSLTVTLRAPVNRSHLVPAYSTQLVA